MLLSDPVTTIPLISSKYAVLLNKLGITTVRDLLTHFPRYHQDTTELSLISAVNKEGQFTFKAYVTAVKSTRLRGGKLTLQKALLSDHTGTIAATWFNQPYLVDTFKDEVEYLFTGQAKQTKKALEFYPKVFEAIIPGKDSVHLGRLSPQYPLTAGIRIKWLRNRIKYIIDHLETAEDLYDQLAKLAKRYLSDLPTLPGALHQIHFPDNDAEIEKAREYLELNELTHLQLKLEQKRQEQGLQSGIVVNVDEAKVGQFVSNLPFKLTLDQQVVIAEILHDLQQPFPMQRLLQGDVGSGKTIVAVIAALATAQAGKQTVILAPTTILAQQHFKSIDKALSPLGISVELVTGLQKKSRSTDIMIGTSAVLSRKQDLIKDLGLVIVDEQHRFGVHQREELLEPLMGRRDAGVSPSSKNRAGKRKVQFPNFLNMTATPIPRTLALGLFGDLEISTIATKPAGRLPIRTHLVPESKRADMHDWVETEVKAGHQIYWMCSLVNESEAQEAKSAIQTYKHLAEEIFPNLRVGLLHGQLKSEVKEDVMAKYAKGEIDILVCTSVIEVGIDVPNATAIIIEDADKFGLAQLHQIRGRVGRNDLQSWCFLFAGRDEPGHVPSQNSIKRLEFFASHYDGLEIAEYDLQSRGPGEVYGTKQSGIPALKIAHLNDIDRIKLSRELAKQLYAQGITEISLFQ